MNERIIQTLFILIVFAAILIIVAKDDRQEAFLDYLYGALIGGILFLCLSIIGSYL